MTAVFSVVLFLAFRATSPPLAIANADSLFFARQYPEAIQAYTVLLGADGRNPQLLWRLARANVCLGESFEDARRKNCCLEAEKAARECLRADSTIAAGHTWLAGALGYIALDEGMERQARLSKEILDEANKALALDPQDDAALSIKGSLFHALGKIDWFKRQMASLLLGGLPDGGFEEGEAALKQAVAIAPQVMRHHYELAVLYYDWERWDEAAVEFERAAALPIQVAIDVPRRAKSLHYLELLKAR